MANRSVKVTLSANVADFKAQLKSASSSLDELASRADKSGQAAQTGLGRITQSMQLQRSQWEQAGAVMTGFGAVTTGVLAGTAKAAIDWESAFAGVKKTAGEGWNLEKLNADLRALASELPSSHAEIAAVAEAAGQLGIREENITSFTRAMINMGEATNLSADEAATTLARFANIMGTSQGEFENLGSSIVALGNNYATTEAEIANMAMRLASAGHQIGLTEGDVLGIATALSSVGIEAEAGGTAFSRVMLDMRKAVDTGSEKLETFAQVAGMSSQAFAQLFQENSGEALTRFIQGLGEMEKAGQSTQPILEELGMTDIRVGNALRSSASAADLFAEAMQTGNQAYSENTALSAEANARYETLASQMEILRNKIVEAAIGFGEQLMPAISLGVDLFSGVVDVIADLPGPVQAVLAGLSGVAGTVALAGGAFALLAPRALEAVSAFQALSATFPALQKGAGALGALSKVALPVAAVTAFAGLVDSAGKINPAPVNELADALSEIAANGSTASDALGSIFNSKWTFGPLRDEVKSTDDVLSQFEKTLNNAWGSSAWEKMDRALGDWNAGDRARDQIEALDGALAQMVNSGNAEQAADLYEQLMETASGMDLEIPADELEGQFSQYAGALESSAEAAEAAGESAGVAADGFDEVGAAAEEAVGSINDLITATSDYAKLNMSADEAAINYAQTLRDVNGLLDEEAFKTASATEQNEMKQSSLIDLAEAGWREIEAMQAQGVEAGVLSGRQNQLAGDFVATAQQMGLTADEAVNLAKKYGLVPEHVKTYAEFQDYQARAQAQGYLAYLQGMDGKTVNTYMYNHLIEIRETRYKGNPLAQGAMTVAANRYAVGGPVYGPGTGTSDSIPAWLSNGEYVIKASSVAKYGRAFFDRLNAGRYANGGYVSARSMSPVVNVAPASLEGLRVGGSFRIGDAIVPLVDGRIEASHRKARIVGRNR